jgi:uncharacterized damage-inducible protein DinB
MPLFCPRLLSAEEMMKDIVIYYARCNKAINAAMNDVIKKHIGKPYELKLDGYFFKELPDLLEHLFVSDMMWLKAFMEIEDYGLSIVEEVSEIPKYGERVFKTYDEYVKYRVILDDFIIKYVERTEEDLFEKTVSRVSRSGERFERKVSKALVHFFNHQTHHRGQVSNILDNMKIENNYSNMIFLQE